MDSDKKPESADGKKARQRRNLALFGFLLGFVLLVYAVTIVKMQSGH